MRRLLPGFRIEEHVFEPSGYSLNGVLDDLYATVHVTPQEHGSYASFESNYDFGADLSAACRRVLEIFRPRAFDVVLFDQGQAAFATPDGYALRSSVEQKLESGYRLRYLAHSRPAETCAAVALPLSGRRDAAVEEETR